MSQNLSSAAVVIGALRVNVSGQFICVWCQKLNHCVRGLRAGSLFCVVVLGPLSSLVIILLRNRELVALL